MSNVPEKSRRELKMYAEFSNVEVISDPGEGLFNGQIGFKANQQ